MLIFGHRMLVMRRVAEMQELVENSEQYLTRQHQRESSDSEGSHISSQDSDAPGQLKHSDSLLLLTQGQKQVPDELTEAVQALDLSVETESDTDSVSTPSNSPSHRNHHGKNRDSDSSFGLHSPDNLVPGAGQEALQELWKRLQEETASLGFEVGGGSLYLDPDIIDLTLLPPPITPEKETVGYALPPEISLPPTPFADSASEASEPLSKEELPLNSAKDVLSLDLDAFLATMTVPPPLRTASTLELTSEQINSFIIPPPPPPTDIPENEETKLNGHVISGNVTNDSSLNGIESVQSSKQVERRGSSASAKSKATFSCCTKPRQQSPDSSPLDLPPRNDSPSPPSRPPKAIVQSSTDSPPLPPRSDSYTGTLTKKPPLPPVPSQDISLKNGYLSLSREGIAVCTGLCERLGQIAAQCNADQAHGGGANIDESRFQTMEARGLPLS
ncbi:uncharacterized protein LOC142328284 [Lycorma delicatula]|uniref:uncharacterized protein LOC142328284 n=1 Tax=Lycorma delicatula TaxID=130591 RepID=UPI003F518815